MKLRSVSLKVRWEPDFEIREETDSYAQPSVTLISLGVGSDTRGGKDHPGNLGSVSEDCSGSVKYFSLGRLD
jgi:hypothetical protein